MRATGQTGRLMGGRFDRRYGTLRRQLDARMRSVVRKREPRDLADGCRYVLAGGGKRIRAILLILSCEAVGGRAGQAVAAGMAVEMLHNFTLVHDDIMDNAPSRRGRPTVHTRWDVNNALLVGDVLLGAAYRTLLGSTTGNTRQLADLLTTALLEVCEGQALDLELARRNGVSLREYFAMIDKKTGRLFATSAELGAVIGGGTAAQIAALRGFGRHLGRAFQLQDDLLDVVADGGAFGKPIGGDIVERKRTYLLLKALERARGADRRYLARVARNSGLRPREGAGTMIARVREIYQRYGVIDTTQSLVRRSTTLAVGCLAKLPTNRSTEMLRWLSGVLMERNS